MKKEKTINMTKGNPYKLLLQFALPLMLGNIFQQMYTLVDTMVVGKGIGVDALAAVGASDWLNWMSLGILAGIAQGFSIPMAQEFGAGHKEKLKKTIGSAISLAGICAVVLLLVFQMIARPILHLLQTPDEILPTAMLYIRIFFAGIPVTMTYNVLAATLRSMGDGKTPLYAMITASITNIVLDVLFVMVLPFGVAGAAVATLVAQVVAAVFCYVQLNRSGGFRFCRADFRLEKKMVWKLLKLSLPLAFQNAIIAVGGMIVQFVVNGFGVLFIAGYTATNKLYGLLEMAAVSFGYAISTYVGQNVGAGEEKRLKSGHIAALVVSLATSFLISACMLLFGKLFIGLFLSGTPEEIVAAGEVAYRYLVFMSLALPALYLLYVYRSALQGMGNTFIPMLSGILEFFMRTGAVLGLTAWIGSDGIFWAEISAWMGAAVLLGISYYRIMVKRKSLMKEAGNEG
ncbi:MAG: MATE family efflux transporter [Lachnospiraceae bacterium]|nr:MATE family efflux transporter [Lachnospiraceae bacterium]